MYDLKGQKLAQAVTGTPGHVNTMAMAVSHFLERFPVETMKPGDVFVTNDPWMGTGHLFDYVTLTPAFRDEDPVAFFASTCHVTDVGGRGFTADAASMFEEGVLIPHMRIRSAGRPSAAFVWRFFGNRRRSDSRRGCTAAWKLSNTGGYGHWRTVADSARSWIAAIDRLLF